MSGKRLKKSSLKRSAGLTAAVLSILLLTSCGTVAESSGVYSESEETAGTKQTSETEEIVSTKQAPESADTMIRADSQLELILEKYDDLYSDFLTDDSILPITVCAVADLNHNGRLEVLLTACLGTGAYSYTKVYEISEDYTDLVNLEYKNSGTNDGDGSGDFYNLAEPGIMVYDCYKKDNEYYYLISDYASSGWSDKYIGFYSYTFGDAVVEDYIGGAAISVNDDDKTIQTWLYDSSFERLKTIEEYETQVNGYWSGYEKQKQCEVKWFAFSDAEGFAANIKDSWEAFNPDSELSSGITYDFKSFFDSIYGGEYEYMIQEE
ncbi:MAG: hypothetical protein K6G47_14055 [Clostridia bacterium]|nr:hypothetical protein [Clostridia bacterium]